MSLLKVEVTGLDSLDKDFEKHKKAIKKQIPTALSIVGAEMVIDLQAIIEGYFYKSYSPKHYQRTGAMKDDASMNYTPKGSELTFTYEPETSHTGLDAWVQDKPVNGKFPLPRKPDDLIIWGQHSHFDGKDYEIEARPFWNYFLESQANEKIMDNFARGMLPQYHVIKEKGEVIDLSDSMLPADTANVAPYDPNTTIDDDLPF
jgi:hypothetical protein